MCHPIGDTTEPGKRSWGGDRLRDAAVRAAGKSPGRCPPGDGKPGRSAEGRKRGAPDVSLVLAMG